MQTTKPRKAVSDMALVLMLPLTVIACTLIDISRILTDIYKRMKGDDDL